jgi:hypothetical protein
MEKIRRFAKIMEMKGADNESKFVILLAFDLIK